MNRCPFSQRRWIKTRRRQFYIDGTDDERVPLPIMIKKVLFFNYQGVRPKVKVSESSDLEQVQSLWQRQR